MTNNYMSGSNEYNYVSNYNSYDLQNTYNVNDAAVTWHTTTSTSYEYNTSMVTWSDEIWQLNNSNGAWILSGSNPIKRDEGNETETFIKAMECFKQIVSDRDFKRKIINLTLNYYETMKVYDEKILLEHHIENYFDQLLSAKELRAMSLYNGESVKNDYRRIVLTVSNVAYNLFNEVKKEIFGEDDEDGDV